MLLPPLLGGLGPPEGSSLIPVGLLLCWPQPGAWGPPFFGDTTTSPLARDTRGPGLPDQARPSLGDPFATASSRAEGGVAEGGLSPHSLQQCSPHGPGNRAAGGSWDAHSRLCHGSHRFVGYPGNYWSFLGIRNEEVSVVWGPGGDASFRAMPGHGMVPVGPLLGVWVLGLPMCQEPCAEGPALPAVQPGRVLHRAGPGAAGHHGGEADHQQRAGGGHPVSRAAAPTAHPVSGQGNPSAGAGCGTQPLFSPQEAEVLVAQAQAPLHKEEGRRGGRAGPGGAGTLGGQPPAAGL